MRQQKTPRQRAEEQLATANRAVIRLAAKKADLQKELDEIARQHSQAVVRRDYLATNPDLGRAAQPTSDARPVGPPMNDDTTSTGATA